MSPQNTSVWGPQNTSYKVIHEFLLKVIHGHNFTYSRPWVKTQVRPFFCFTQDLEYYVPVLESWVWVQRILVLKLSLRTEIVALNSTHCNRVRSCLVQGNKKSSPCVSHYTTAPSVCWENIWHYMPHGDNFMLPWRKLEKRFLFNTSIFVSSFDPDLSPSPEVQARQWTRNKKIIKFFLFLFHIGSPD